MLHTSKTRWYARISCGHVNVSEHWYGLYMEPFFKYFHPSSLVLSIPWARFVTLPLLLYACRRKAPFIVRNQIYKAGRFETSDWSRKTSLYGLRNVDWFHILFWFGKRICLEAEWVWPTMLLFKAFKFLQVCGLATECRKLQDCTPPK